MIATDTKFINLMCKVDNVEGHTADGRVFNATYQKDRGLKISIFENGNVFEGTLQIREVINYNLLSLINKMEKYFFTNRKPMEIERKSIQVYGNKDSDDFNIDVSIENTRVVTFLNYLGQSIQLQMTTKIPEYISKIQKHGWLYLHYQKSENWIDILKYNIKDIWFKCCGHHIRGNHNYCNFCGKKQEVTGLKIQKVVGEELLTRLV